MEKTRHLCLRLCSGATGMNLRALSLRQKIAAGVAAFLVVVGGVSLTVEDITNEVATRAKEALEENHHMFDRSVELTRLTKQIQVDVVQVQQWLTDISATRGLDGLNDGFDEAASFAERLPNDIAAAREIAEGLGMTGYATALDAVSVAFPP
ncbi:MAG: hypothetical protein KDJ16_15045, partial [Hyphomicrobiales bacterium]|nr:hypothetical protein [Hyphomicrobiales bacterium]